MALLLFLVARLVFRLVVGPNVDRVRPLGPGADPGQDLFGYPVHSFQASMIGYDIN